MAAKKNFLPETPAELFLSRTPSPSPDQTEDMQNTEKHTAPAPDQAGENRDQAHGKFAKTDKQTRRNRLQILVTDRQLHDLKSKSAETGLSVNEIISRSIDSFLS